MVTADRPQFCRRAILAYQKQTYPNKELVVLDNGKEPMASLLEGLPSDEVRYLHIERTPDLYIGGLRNQALEMATGTYVIPQWDDDDWSHPERLTQQAAVLEEGHDACTLAGYLVHFDNPAYFAHPFIGLLREGTCLMHRRDSSIRYPNLQRTSDTVYIKSWLGRPHAQLPLAAAHLYVRYFHGGNLWDETHILQRMRNTPLDLFLYAWHKHVRGNEFGHRRFKLSAEAQEAFQLYQEDSVEAGLFEQPQASQA